jgi:hypothetical protein
MGVGGSWASIPWQSKWHVVMHPFLAMAAWIVAALALHYRSIHFKQISDGGMVVASVAPGFVAALAQHRASQASLIPLRLPRKPAWRIVRFTRTEISGQLPAVCICCGKPGMTWQEEGFAMGSTPPSILAQWATAFASVISLGWLVAVFFHRPRARHCLQAPFCEFHSRHWWWRRVIFFAGPLAALIAGLAGYSLFFADDPRKMFLTVFGVASLWFMVGFIANHTAVRVLDATPESLVLNGVSPCFIEALEAEREQGR